MSPPGKRGQFFCETVKVLTGLKRFQSDLDFQFSKDPWTLVFQRDFGFGHFIPDFSRDWFLRTIGFLVHTRYDLVFRIVGLVFLFGFWTSVLFCFVTQRSFIN